MSFPKGFVWGAATASYQVEGAVSEDGRGLSVWDMFCRKEGTIWNNQSGAVACDHYARYQEDVALMQAIGLQAYRFSVAWSRVLPAGTGAINAKGLGFYDRLVDALLNAGVTPYLTLFHWDFPYALYCRGGWLNPASPDWFAEYTTVLVDALSDRVRHWITLNEPQCFIQLGHYDGVHAPGDRLGWREVLQAGHHALLAHGKAVQVIRARAKTSPQVGFAPVTTPYYPATDAAEDVEATRRATITIWKKNLWNNTWFQGPVFDKAYPEDGLKLFGDAAPTVGPTDMDTIGQPLDFYGMNLYSGSPIRAGRDGALETVPYAPGHPQTPFPWFITPSAMYWAARFLYDRFKLPLLITENGMPNPDWIALDGKVHDPQRVDFTTRYLKALSKAGEDGVKLGGYFHWSLMDNFEWAEGFKHRFGLIHVDYTTQKRTLKDSAAWYREVIATNGAVLGQADLPGF